MDFRKRIRIQINLDDRFPVIAVNRTVSSLPENLAAFQRNRPVCLLDLHHFGKTCDIQHLIDSVKHTAPVFANDAQPFAIGFKAKTVHLACSRAHLQHNRLLRQRRRVRDNRQLHARGLFDEVAQFLRRVFLRGQSLRRNHDGIRRRLAMLRKHKRLGSA